MLENTLDTWYLQKGVSSRWTQLSRSASHLSAVQSFGKSNRQLVYTVSGSDRGVGPTSICVRQGQRVPGRAANKRLPMATAARNWTYGWRLLLRCQWGIRQGIDGTRVPEACAPGLARGCLWFHLQLGPRPEFKSSGRRAVLPSGALDE